MELKIQVHAPEEAKEVVERITTENLKKKIGNYLKQFNGKDIEGKGDLKIYKNKKGLFNGTLQININGNNFRYTREDFKNLDDLVNHLFDHFKEELAQK